MGKRAVRLSALGAALTANALRPFPSSNPLAIPSFFAGWLTSELAPQNLIVTAAASNALVLRKRRRLSSADKAVLALNAASTAG
ncbi:MAG TPA: alpha/beta hydrolase, partial [Mycobacteriales bacterium]|nr:alpha/beta hydrolase [Mycobacteriales bacterium]